MSVINQVLNQLEQRGVQGAPEQTLIRAIPPVRRASRYRTWLLLATVVLLGGAGLAQWLTRTGDSPTVDNDAPLGTAASAVVADFDQPASRMSLELSALPLPDSLRAMPAAKPPLPAAPLREAPALPAARSALAPEGAGGLGEPVKRVSAAQQADAEFRRAAGLMQQGRIADALAGYESALRIHAAHESARQALVALLLEQNRAPDAERVLQEGLSIKLEHGGFAMTLARLQVERGALDSAVQTLEAALPHHAERAEYQAFLAALLQRQGRHLETLEHYQIALRIVPGNGLWQMGYGISLEALRRNTEARAAFKLALGSGSLNPELQKFVQQKLK